MSDNRQYVLWGPTSTSVVRWLLRGGVRTIREKKELATFRPSILAS